MEPNTTMQTYTVRQIKTLLQTDFSHVVKQTTLVISNDPTFGIIFKGLREQSRLIA